ncbi:MAG: prolyl aminopeptidase [Jatrophihabitans sp.]|uniref:prolyl aminopeptidase n=1 Tax=Jatrophihabitans sp. TaxID=1932789 RepID=UPI003F80A677
MAGPLPVGEPDASGLLDVGDGHQVYWETVGDPAGPPAVFLHGGPGSGCSVNQRRLFTPDGYRGVLFDQRGCGRSRPHVADHDTALDANTTDHLVADIEALREHLGIERWLVWGGSWGVTLALAYAERFPERVTAMVLVAITNTTPAEIDWLYGGLGRFFPAEWAAFRAHVGAGPDASGTDLARAYDRLLDDADPAVRQAAAHAWCTWEDAVVALDADRRPRPREPRAALAFARLCAHYFSRHGFLPDGSLLAGAGRLTGIPAVLVHGRLDLTAPLATAWALAQAWPDAELQVIDGAGHATGPGMHEAIAAAMRRFRG